MRENRPQFWLILPAITIVALITQGLFLGTIILSTLKWNLIRPDLGIDFIGISNFIKLFTNFEIYQIFWNTLRLGTIALFFCFWLGLGIALMLNQEFWGVHVLRGLILIPFFITDVATGIIFKTLILHPSFGILGYIAGQLGTAPLDFMGRYAAFSVVGLIIWQWTPFFVLVLLAGLQGLDTELIQSARIDGASRLRTLFHITIPYIWHQIEVVVMLGTIFILKIFGLIYVTTSGGPGISTTTLPYIVFKVNLFKWEIGEAASYSVLTVILTLFLLTSLYKFFQNRHWR